MADPHWVGVGRIGRAHGTRGAVRVVAWGETLATRGLSDKLYLRSPTGEIRELTLEEFSCHQRNWLARFAGVTTRDVAESLTGQELFLPEDQLPQLEEGEYYHYQLVGLQVETTDGASLGIVRKIIPTGSNDVYVVQHDTQERLIPALRNVIQVIDLEHGAIHLAATAGLFA